MEYNKYTTFLCPSDGNAMYSLEDLEFIRESEQRRGYYVYDTFEQWLEEKIESKDLLMIGEE